MKKDRINKVESVDLTIQEKTVNDFILQTLFFTPLSYIKTRNPLEMRVYAFGDDQPSMKILRIIARGNYESNPKLIEIAFQDEVDMLKEGKMDLMKRWQLNFSILVNRESYKFHSLYHKPEEVSYISESIKIFEDLSKIRGSSLYVGGWRFQSDGNGWVRVDRDGKPIKQSSEALLSIDQFI